MNKKREARRKRDREDFIRATTAATSHYKRPAGTSSPGATAGYTYREHLENKLDRAVEVWRKKPTDTARGVIRGLAIALLYYEDSYHADDKSKLLKLERQFMEEKK